MRIVPRRVLANAVLGLWDVVNDLTRLRPSSHVRYRVFGHEMTRRVAAELAAMGCDIITGSGPGLMPAANEGACSDPEHSRSVGICVDLPFEQHVAEWNAQRTGHLWAIINRIPEAVIRQWVGHVDPRILQLYTHIADEQSQQAMARLEDCK